MLTDTKGPRPSDRWIPWYFVAFFVVLTLVLAHLVWLAVGSYPGTVSDRAYEQGLAYNKNLQAAAQQEALGWRGKVTVTAVGTATQLRYVLRGADGQLLKDAKIYCWLYRAANSKLDERLELIAQSDGSYGATVTFPAKGAWEVRLAAKAQGHDFQQTERVVIP
ncbi:MAG: FixH family protein [Alphaproteobacteria bacterium]|nr:FixH family protein [Alphaproteobacteria bacterium]